MLCRPINEPKGGGVGHGHQSIEGNQATPSRRSEENRFSWQFFSRAMSEPSLLRSKPNANVGSPTKWRPNPGCGRRKSRARQPVTQSGMQLARRILDVDGNGNPERFVKTRLSVAAITDVLPKEIVEVRHTWVGSF